MVTIDIRTAIIPESRRIWRLFPGRSYAFLDQFAERNVAFLDLPGFDLPAGSLVEKSAEILKRIAAAERAVSDWRKGEVNASPPDWQSVKVRNTPTRGRIVSAAINFFEVAAKGDLIVVPSSIGLGEIRIGEFTSSPDIVRRVQHRRYADFAIPARPVKWLRVVPEHQVSPAVPASLRHEHPFALLEKSFFPEIFSFAYDNFVYGDRHSSVIYNTKADYLDKDAALIGIISQMAAYACELVESGQKDKFDAKEILRILLSQADVSYSCSQTADIHSPGFNRFVSGKATPIIISAVVAAMLAFAGLTNQSELKSEIAQLEITNSIGGQDDKCSQPVSDATRMLLTTTDIEIVWQLCRALHATNERAGLEPGVTAIVPTPRARPPL